MGFQIELDGAAHEVEILGLRPLKLRIDGVSCVVTSPDNGENGRREFEIDGKPIRFARAHVGARQILRLGGRTFDALLIDPRDAADAGGHAHDHVRAPMPGTLIHIHKRSGEAVSRGEALVTIESMKLQMTLSAPRDGVLASLTRSVGETFDKDEIVAELEPLHGV
jgi:acetyl/propionyl-CoA carboxylase alpha subunit